MVAGGVGVDLCWEEETNQTPWPERKSETEGKTRQTGYHRKEDETHLNAQQCLECEFYFCFLKTATKKDFRGGNPFKGEKPQNSTAFITLSPESKGKEALQYREGVGAHMPSAHARCVGQRNSL